MRAIILAQGLGSRLQPAIGNLPKQLVDVGGWSVIERTTWMLSEVCETIIIGPPSLAEANLHGARLTTLWKPGLCILQGLAQTAWAWVDDRTVILLGDVLYSLACLERLLRAEEPIVFAGTRALSGSEGELFGMTFNGYARDRVLFGIMNRPCTDHGVVAQPGHLRLLWTYLSALGPSTVAYQVVDDYTDDLDEPSDLDELRAWRAGAAYLDMLEGLGVLPVEVAMARAAWVATQPR